MLVLGVDPGKSGAMCLYDGTDVKFFDTPTYNANKTKYDLSEMASRLFCIVKEAAENKEKIHAVIEQVSGRTNEGTVSSRTMGYGEGIWHMAFAIFQIPYKTVTPQTWKAAFGLIGAEKKASIVIAKQRFPLADLTLVKHHNRAEALLMALWYWEKMK